MVFSYTAWTLAPGPAEHSTKVELSCYVAGEKRLPKFVLKLTLGRQPDFVKTAERKELQLEASGKPARADKMTISD